MFIPLVLIFATQFIMFPFFMGFNIVSKIIFFIFSFLCLILFKRIKLSLNKNTIYFILFSCPTIFFSSLSSKIYPLASISVFFVLISYLFFSICYLPLFFRENKNIEKFFSSYLVFVTTLCSLGIYQFSSFVSLGESHHELIPYLLPANKGLRITGIYGQSNIFALILLVGLLIYIYKYIHDESFNDKKIIGFIPFLLNSIAFFLTDSRSSLLALIFIILFLLSLVLRGKYLCGDHEKIKKLFFLILIILISFVLVKFLIQFFSSGVTRSTISPGLSLDARLVYWGTALLIFFDHPVLGVGLGNFKFYFSKYVVDAHHYLSFLPFNSMGYTKWAHNEFLQILCECGFIVGIVILLLLIRYFRGLLSFRYRSDNWSALQLYCYLFLAPFIIQSMFSWPLRHPAVLMFFCSFIALLLARYESFKINCFGSRLFLLKSIAIAGLCIVCFVGFLEYRMFKFSNKYSISHSLEEFEKFSHYPQAPYTEFPMLLKFTPLYLKEIIAERDYNKGRQLLPFFDKLASLQGAHWQWYNLARLTHVLGKNEKAKKAIQNAIDLWPVEQGYWNFQHYLNMFTAAEKTNRDIEEFFPIPPNSMSSKIEGFIDSYDRYKLGK